MRTSYPTLLSAATLALLTACAAPTSPQANATNAQTEPATATAATVAPTIFKEGPVAEFSKTESKLDSADISNITKNIEAFKKAKWIEVTGYCDYKDNPAGAQKLALARAGAVQAELIKQGVPAKKIYLKYALSQARHGASVVLK